MSNTCTIIHCKELNDYYARFDGDEAGKAPDFPGWIFEEDAGLSILFGYICTARNIPADYEQAFKLEPFEIKFIKDNINRAVNVQYSFYSNYEDILDEAAYAERIEKFCVEAAAYLSQGESLYVLPWS